MAVLLRGTNWYLTVLESFNVRSCMVCNCNAIKIYYVYNLDWVVFRINRLNFPSCLQPRREPRICKMIQKINEHFRESVQKGHLIIDMALFMDTRDSSSKSYGQLRNLISKHAKAQPNWGEELPMRWLLLFSKLNEMAQNGRKIISKKDLRQLNTTLPSPLQIDEIEVFLKFHHSLGHILYFQDPSMQDTIVLDPTLVVDAFRSLISSPLLCQSNTIRKKAWWNLQLGIITEKEISDIWSYKEFESLEDHRDHLLAMMVKLDLLAKPKRYVFGKTEESKYFFVPAMLKESGENKISDIVERHKEGGSVSFDFKRKLLPAAIFSRLLAACLSMWPVEKKEKKHLYSGMCLYEVDKFHSMLIRKVDHVIHLSITHNRKQSSISQRLCFELQNFIQGTLDKIMTLYPCHRGERAYDIHNPYPDPVVGCHNHSGKIVCCTEILPK